MMLIYFNNKKIKFILLIKFTITLIATIKSFYLDHIIDAFICQFFVTYKAVRGVEPQYVFIFDLSFQFLLKLFIKNIQHTVITDLPSSKDAIAHFLSNN